MPQRKTIKTDKDRWIKGHYCLSQQREICATGKVVSKQIFTCTNCVRARRSVSRGRDVKRGLLLSLYPALLHRKQYCQPKSCQPPSEQGSKRGVLDKRGAAAVLVETMSCLWTVWFNSGKLCQLTTVDLTKHQFWKKTKQKTAEVLSLKPFPH